MKSNSMKWMAAAVSALLVGAFEFARHEFLHIIPLDWGNLLVAVLTGVLFAFYFNFMFTLLDRANRKLEAERRESSVLQERDRIGRELHDSVAQSLFFMNIKAAEIEAAIGDNPELHAKTHDLQDAIKLTDREVRKHIFMSQKLPDEKNGLINVVRNFIDKYQEKTGLPINLIVEGDVDSLLNIKEVNLLFQMFQEMLRNIQKHAEATKVTVWLATDGSRFSMVIRDNGKGFRYEIVKSQHSSFGLNSLEEDARALGARIDVLTSPGAGTLTAVRFQSKWGLITL